MLLSLGHIFSLFAWSNFLYALSTLKILSSLSMNSLVSFEHALGNYFIFFASLAHLESS